MAQTVLLYHKLQNEDQPIQQHIGRQVLSQATIEEMPATVHVSSANSSSGTLTIRVNIDIDSKRLATRIVVH